MAIGPRRRFAAIALTLLIGLPAAILVAAHLVLAFFPDLVRARTLAAAETACGCKLGWKSWSIVLLRGEIASSHREKSLAKE